MAETYTIGGNAYEKVRPTNKLGQVFRVSSKEIVSYIDLNVNISYLYGRPLLEIYDCDYFGVPWGYRLSRSGYYYGKKPLKYGKTRIRFAMSPFLLTPGNIFVMVLSYFTGLLELFEWQYDKDDSPYWSRGWRMTYDKVTDIWTPHAHQAHIFCEFGEPPLPNPDPPPPIDHFAVQGIGQHPIPDGIQFDISTSVPCHMSCYWTDREPTKRFTTRVVRGVRLPWHTVFSFSAWHKVEQIEPGDTLYHTFNLTPWPYCETRWITFRGTVDDLKSKSVGPIFKIHKDFGAIIKFEHYMAAFDTALLTTSTTKLAQTFTPQTTHTLTQVVLPLYRFGFPGVMNVGITGTTPTGRPDDIILTQDTFNADMLPTTPPPAGEGTTILIDPHLLIAGKQYAMIIWGGDNTNRIAWNAHSPNPYPLGRAWYWIAGPDNWFGALTYDFLFEEWGYVI